MNKGFKSNRHTMTWALIMISALVTLSCGGGGGGGDSGGGGVPPASTTTAGELSYTGATRRAQFSAGNAKLVLDDTLGSNQGANEVIATSNSAAAAQNATLSLLNSVSHSSRMTIQSAAVRRAPTARPIDETHSCDTGTVHLKGTVEADGTGSVTLTFAGCRVMGLTLTGSMAVAVTVVDPVSAQETDVTLAISKIIVTGPTIDAAIGGNIRIQTNPSSAVEKTTYNVIQQDNRTSHQVNLVNLVEVDTPSGAGYTSSLFGRVYDSTYGYVDIVTEKPVVLADHSAEFPNSGGPIIIKGAANTSLRVTPKGGSSVYLEGDFNGDGRYESIAATDWNSLSKDGTGSNNSPPNAYGDADRSVVVSDAASISGMDSMDADHDFITFKWSITTRPMGSTAALIDADLPVAIFSADMEGDYEITLVVTDSRGASGFTVLRVKAITRYPLSMNVIDAEYSKPLERVILVASSPASALHVYDPVTGSDVSIALSSIPTSVSVSPDGLFAAVGHNGAVSYVDLVRGELIRTYTVGADIYNLVLASNGYIYGFPDGTVYNPGEWVDMHIINIATGADVIPTGTATSGQSKGAVQPLSMALYITPTTRIDPLMINWYDISNGVFTTGYRSLTSVRYSDCGDFWFSDDGVRMYTRCGFVFSVPTHPPYDSDLVYSGTIEGGYMGSQIISLSDSISAGRFSIIETGNRTNDPLVNDDDAVTFFDRVSLAKKSRISFPVVSVQGKDYSVHGLFVFYDLAGTHTTVVGRADSSSGLKNDYYMMHF